MNTKKQAKITIGKNDVIFHLSGLVHKTTYRSGGASSSLGLCCNAVTPAGVRGLVSLALLLLTGVVSLPGSCGLTGTLLPCVPSPVQLQGGGQEQQGDQPSPDCQVHHQGVSSGLNVRLGRWGQAGALRHWGLNLPAARFHQWGVGAWGQPRPWSLATTLCACDPSPPFFRPAPWALLISLAVMTHNLHMLHIVETF